MLCGLPVALSAIETEAVRLLMAVGWNVMLIVQFAPTATELPQVFVWLKSDGLVPVMEILLMLSVALPVLVNVTVFGFVVWPTATGAKNVTLEGDNCTCVPLLVPPVPLRVNVCGLAPPLSLMDTSALRVPVAVGWNVMVRMQLPPAATELPQLFVSVKSEGFVPPREMPVMLRAVLPTLVSVTV